MRLLPVNDVNYLGSAVNLDMVTLVRCRTVGVPITHVYADLKTVDGTVVEHEIWNQYHSSGDSPADPKEAALAAWRAFLVELHAM